MNVCDVCYGLMTGSNVLFEFPLKWYLLRIKNTYISSKRAKHSLKFVISKCSSYANNSVGVCKCVCEDFGYIRVVLSERDINNKNIFVYIYKYIIQMFGSYKKASCHLKVLLQFRFIKFTPNSVVPTWFASYHLVLRVEAVE